MNRTYRSIWNPSLGAYVAVAETQSSHGRPVSASRSVRRRAGRALLAPMVLEPRIVFDAAIAATVTDVASSADPVIETADAPESEGAAEDAQDSDAEAVAQATPDAQDEAPDDATELPTAASPTQDDEASPDEVSEAVSNQEDPEVVAEEEALPEGEDAEAVAAVAQEPVEPALAADESPTQAPVGREVVFVDPVTGDLGDYIDRPDAEIVYLDATRDGVEQMAEALREMSDVTAIHIVGHGVEGQLMLGNTVLDSESMLAEHRALLEEIGAALSEDGDILIYGCDFTAGDTGLEAARLLSEITGADVAASDDTTGHADKGGDWNLETTVGQVQALALTPTEWVGNLDLVMQSVGAVGDLALAQAIMGPGVTINSATYTGGSSQAGVFTTGGGLSFGTDILEFTEGAVFTTHSDITSVTGTNTAENTTADATGPDGDPDFVALSPSYTSHDASFIVIDFTPDVYPGSSAGDTGRMTASIVFGSEEYNEYVYAGFNDSIGIWVNGVNVALAPNGLSIGIDTINDAATYNPASGAPANDPNPGHDTSGTTFTSANPNLYINNSTGAYITQMDGFTVTISLTFDVIVGQSNTIKLGIADTGDASYDSWLFVKAESLQTALVAEHDTVTTPANVPTTVDVTANDFNLSGSALSIVAINGGAVSPGDSVVLASGVTVTLGSGGNVTVEGDGTNAVTDTFTYTVTNVDGQSANAIVSLNITAPTANQAPVAGADSFAAGEDDAAAVVGNALGNDSDADGGTITATVQSGVAGSGGGLFSIDASGAVTFDPNGAFETLAVGETVTTSFTYQISDGQGGSASASVTVTVTGANDAPAVASANEPADQSASDGQTITPLDVSPAFTDVDGDTLVYSAVGLPTGLSINPSTGVISGSIAADASQGGPSSNGSYTVTVTATDPSGATANTVFDYAVSNPAPVAVADSFAAGEDDDAATVGNALGNDSDADGDTITATVQSGVAGSAGGLFSIDASGAVTFDPNGDFEGLAAGETTTTSFTYQISDGEGGSASATVTVTVTGANDAPAVIGANEPADQSGNDGQTITPLDVSGAFSDVDGDTLVYSAVGLPAGLAIDPSTGVISGSIAADASQGGPSSNGSYTVTVTATDPSGATANTVFDYAVSNPAPVAVADSFAAGEDDGAAVVGNALGNDTDADGDTITVTTQSGVAGSNGGLFSIDASGAVTFDPNGAFEGLAAGETTTTSFTYQISDGEGGSASASVTVTVTGANDAPAVVGANEPADQSGNDGQTITPLDVSPAFTDVDGDTLVYSAVGLPTGLSINSSSGVISGSIAANASQGGPSSNGSYTVTVTATDPSGATANTVFDYTVSNPAPVANADSFAAGEDDGAATVGNALGNDSDADGDTITATVQSGVAGSAGGLFSIDASGAVTFDPNGAFEGLAAGETTTTSFTYQISDGEGGSASASVTVTVTGANDAPDVVSANEPADQSGNDGQTITPLDVSPAFSDTDGDTLVYSAVGLPAGLAINPSTGVISGSIAADASQGGPSSNGSYTVTVTATDPSGGAANTVFDYAVSNPAPVANADSFAAGEDDSAAVVGNALGNDSDVDGDTLTVTTQSGVVGSGGGLFAIDASGAVTFDPNGDFAGLAAGATTTTSFTYQISDGEGGSASASVTVTVSGANGAPEVVSGHEPADQSGNDGQAITPLDVSGAFSDVDGDTLVYSAVGLPAGLAIDPSTGVISGSIAADASQGGPSSDGSYTVTVTATDPSGGAANTVFDYAVSNPAPVAVGDSFAAGEDDGAAVVGNALGNDSDADGDTLTVTTQSGVAGSNGGLFSIDASGAVTFDPNGAFETLAAGETVTTSFTYQISDGQGGSASATVTVTVTGANDAPLAQDDGPLDVAPGTPVTGNVLDNDSDVEAEPLVVSGFDVDADGDGVAESYQPGQTVVVDEVGTLVIEVNGDFSFSPAPGYAGPVPDITYHVSDGHDESSAQLSFADVPAVPAPPEPEPTPQPPAPTEPEPTPPAPPPSAPPTERPVSATPAAPEAPAVPPSVTEATVTPVLHVLTTVDSMYAESALASNGLTVAGLDLPFMAEIRSMPRDGHMFDDSAESASQVSLVRDGIGMPEPALYVQQAVRHEPITNDHGIYIQRVVRAMQAESRLVDARLRAQANLMSFGDDLLTRTRELADGIAATDFPAQADETSQPDTRSAAPGCDGQAACDARSAAEPQATTPTGEADHASDRQPSAERGLAATLSRKAAPGLRAQLASWANDRGGRDRPVVRSAARL